MPAPSREAPDRLINDEIAERIIREHQDRCIGDYDPGVPWCSCAPEGEPLCAGCTKLQKAISTALSAAKDALQAERDRLRETLLALADDLDNPSAPLVLKRDVTDRLRAALSAAPEAPQ